MAADDGARVRQQPPRDSAPHRRRDTRGPARALHVRAQQPAAAGCGCRVRCRRRRHRGRPHGPPGRQRQRQARVVWQSAPARGISRHAGGGAHAGVRGYAAQCAAARGVSGPIRDAADGEEHGHRRQGARRRNAHAVAPARGGGALDALRDVPRHRRRRRSHRRRVRPRQRLRNGVRGGGGGGRARVRRRQRRAHQPVGAARDAHPQRARRAARGQLAPPGPEGRA
mmetsp:Transcript_18892/g.47076  ORF Transcript_18892/g.47076 Transcript_18892/m.47076 type:complete len:226 (-) Transcript_18892:900-1577(-)